MPRDDDDGRICQTDERWDGPREEVRIAVVQPPSDIYVSSGGDGGQNVKCIRFRRSSGSRGEHAVTVTACIWDALDAATNLITRERQSLQTSPNLGSAISSLENEPYKQAGLISGES